MDFSSKRKHKHGRKKGKKSKLCNNSGSLKDQIFSVLEKVNDKALVGEFAVGRTSKELPSTPGIEVVGYGPVALPITAATVEGLRKYFDEAPYGLGEKTLIDKNVRKSWQLDPDKFEITNPNFISGVEKVVRQVKQDLGCSATNVSAKLYKLLLYEPGGHFKPHRDTEKHNGMFGTLIIQVPSVFTGGDLVVKHGSNTKCIVFSNPDAKFLCHYAAHYADCEHELTEISSGYRMALIYSLCWDGNGIVPTPPGLDDPAVNLVGLLEQFEAFPELTKLAWVLDHQYSEHSFMGWGTQALKGGDKHVAAAIQNANLMLEEGNKIDMFIVEATKEEELHGSCTMEDGGWFRRDDDCFDHNGDSETSYEYKFITSEGQSYNMDCNFSLDIEKEVLNVDDDEDDFWGDCEEGECSGPSGNEGATKSNWYHCYCLVFWPRSKTLAIMIECGLDTAVNYVKSHIDKAKTEKEKAAAIHELETLLMCCANENNSLVCHVNRVENLLSMVTAMKELSLAVKLANLLKEEYTVRSYGYWNSQPETKCNFGIPSIEIIKHFVQFITIFGWQAVSEPLLGLFKKCPDNHLGNLSQFILQCPKDVPVADLFITMIQRVLGLANSGNVLKVEILKNVFHAVFVHIQLCAERFDALLEMPPLQSLSMLYSLLEFLKEKLSTQNLKDNAYYSKIVNKFLQQMRKDAEAMKLNSPAAVATVVKAVSFVAMMKNNTQIKEFIAGVLLQNPNAELLNKLLSCYCESPNGQYSVLAPLVKARLDQLQPIVMAGKPAFSWRQPTASLPEHPEVEAFLRGPQKTYVYQRFQGINHARNWASKYFSRFGTTLSAVVETKGTGRRSHAIITKTTGGFQKVLQQYNRDCEEYNRLNKSLPMEQRRPDIPLGAVAEPVIDLTG